MRGRLGIGTERIVDRRDQRHVRHSTRLSRLICCDDGEARRAPQRLGKHALEQERREARRKRCRCGDQPDTVWQKRERKAAGRASDSAAELEAEAVQREIPTEQAGLREIGDQRVLDRAVEAFAEPGGTETRRRCRAR
jgi:hypothetical protein